MWCLQLLRSNSGYNASGPVSVPQGVTTPCEDGMGGKKLH